MAKQSSPDLSSLAASVLKRPKPEGMTDKDWAEIKALAGSVLSQDETRGQDEIPPGPDDVVTVKISGGAELSRTIERGVKG